MKNLLTSLRYVPKHFGVAAAVLVAGAAAALSFAWGPERRTFTTASPAPYITFNSITDNPAYGDERNFMRVKPADAPDSAYSDRTALVAGKQYEVYIYFHNNAAANLNLTATNTTVQTQLPAVVNGDTQSVTYINSPDANPVKIWDETTLTSTSPVYLRMVPGSAVIHSFGAVNGKVMPDSIITTGTILGYNALDGKVPGCNQYAGYVTFRFVADQPNFEINKLVSKHGANQWVESYAAQPGETVDYLLKYKNTGTTVQNDVLMKDQLPAGMTYVTGSSMIANPTNPGGVKTNDGVTGAGLNIGNYGPNQNAWVMFSAKAPNADALACGVNTLTNKEVVDTKSGSKTDTAVVTIDKYCAPTPKYTCDKLTVDTISRAEFKFTVTKTVVNASYVKTVFVVRNEAGSEVARFDDADGVATFTRSEVGKYTVEATVVVTVNGVEKTATSTACKQPFEVLPLPNPETPAVEISKAVNGKETAEVNVGENFTYTLVVKNPSKVTLKNVVVTDNAPAGIQFVSAKTGTTNIPVTGNKISYTIPQLNAGQSVTIEIVAKATVPAKTPVVNTACVNAPEVNPNEPTKTDDCDDASTTTPEVPVDKVAVCDQNTGNIVYVAPSEAGKYEPKDSPKCKDIRVCDVTTRTIIVVKGINQGKYAPENDPACAPIPTVIPSTGPEAFVSGLFGTSAVGYGLYAYAASRRALKNARH